MRMIDGLTYRRSAAFSGVNTRSSSVQITRRAQRLRLQPGCRQPILLSGLSTYNRLSATPIRHDAPLLCASSTPQQASRQPSLPSTCPGSGTATPVRSLAASAAWASDFGFTSSSNNQQQQYQKHVQLHQDFPGGRQQKQKQSQPPQQWQGNSIEARHRKGGNQEQGPVFSYQQLFQEMTPTAAGASNGKGSRLQAQQSSKGFGSKGSKPRKAGSNGTGPSGSDKDAVPGKAHVQLCITRQVEYGQNMRVTGSDGLGSWNADNGPKLKWHEGHKWSADLLLPPGGYEFKFLLEHRSGHLEWENGSNRSFEVPKTAAEMVVDGHWNRTEDTEVLELQQHAAYRQEINELQNKTEDAADRDRQATARAEAAAFAAANKAAAAAYKQQADAEAEVAALRAQKRAEALAAVPPAPADLFKFDLSVLDSEVPGSDQLMEVLLGFRQDMLEGLYGVTSTMQEIQDDLAQVQSQMNQLAAERFLAQSGPVDAATAQALESGNAVPWPQQAETAAIIAADAAVANEAALSGLQNVVQTWQAELVNFRQDSMDLREEMEALRHSLEGQMQENTAALHDLEYLVKQLMGAEGGVRVGPAAPQRPANVVAAAAVAPAPPAAGVSGGPPGSSEMLDKEDKMLLERINHLASDLSAEMKEAVQELEQQQQSLLERHQHIISDLSPSPNSNNTKARMPLDLGFGIGMRMQPTNAAGVLGGRAAAPAGHVVRAAANWLASHNVQQYHQGLVVAVLMSAGLWRDSMWEELDKGALRSTYSSYKSVWSGACLQTWKDSITTKQALLTALSTGRQQLLSMHILWSLQELCTHCRQLQDVLPEVATPIELGLMQKLRQRGGAGQGWALGVEGAPVGGGEAAAAAQCAVLLQRWLSAADNQW